MTKRKIRYADVFEEGTEEYAWFHVDVEALNELFEILKRIRRSKGFLGPQYDWYDNECPSLKVPMEYNPSQVASDRRALERATNMKDVLQPAADVAYRVWELINGQVKTCEEDIEAYKSRRGFFLLPDEVLSTVLEFAAVPPPRHDRTRASIFTMKAATKLSHVCKRFRTLIVHSSVYWQHFPSEMKNIDMVSTCLSRCRSANAEISLSTAFFPKRGQWEVYELENSSFIQAVIERKANWQIFSVESYSEDWDLDEFNAGQLRELANLTIGLDLLNLSAISIAFPRILLSTAVKREHKLRDVLHFYSTWVTPKLQSLLTYNLVPNCFSGTSTLTSLTVYLNFDRHLDKDQDLAFDVQSMVTFLAACPVLSKFELSVLGAMYSIEPAPSIHPIEMNRVIRLDIAFSKCHVKSIKPLFSVLHFPHVSTMRLNILSQEDETKHGMHFNNVFRAIIPGADAFPKLVDLSLIAYNDGYVKQAAGEERIRVPGSISIPLETMPNLMSLELHVRSTVIQPITESVTLPAIRTLVLNNCTELEKDWLARILRHSVAQGNLDFLRVSVLGSCYALNECGIEGTLTKEDIIKVIA